MIRSVAVIALIGLIGGVAWAADGGAIYDKKCKMCHSIAGAGGPMAKVGGPVDDAATKHDEAWLRAYLKDPKSKVPASKMPKVTLSDDELDAVIKHLLALKKQ